MNYIREKLRVKEDQLYYGEIYQEEYDQYKNTIRRELFRIAYTHNVPNKYHDNSDSKVFELTQTDQFIMNDIFDDIHKVTFEVVIYFDVPTVGKLKYAYSQCKSIFWSSKGSDQDPIPRSNWLFKLSDTEKIKVDINSFKQNLNSKVSKFISNTFPPIQLLFSIHFCALGK